MMEWITVSLDDVTFGSIIRWNCRMRSKGVAPEFTYAIHLPYDMLVDLSNGMDYSIHHKREAECLEDFVQVLRISNEAEDLPSESILELAQLLIENSTGEKVT